MVLCCVDHKADSPGIPQEPEDTDAKGSPILQSLEQPADTASPGKASPAVDSTESEVDRVPHTPADEVDFFP